LKLVTIDTQLQKVLRHLETGATLTPMEAFFEYGSLSLQYQVWKLRHTFGYNIITNMKTNVNGKRYASYRLISPDGN
jgi:hypothetical protein